MAGRGHTKTHCLNGHERTPENVDPRNRQCKICHSEQAKTRYAERVKNLKPRKTHCKNGHERTPENLYRGACYVCMKARTKERVARTRWGRRRVDVANNPAIAGIVKAVDEDTKPKLEGTS